MPNVETLLLIIAILLLLVLFTLLGTSKRLKEQFPTEEERDQQWAKEDPLGHYEAHKKDNK
jgi:hypothetical protein